MPVARIAAKDRHPLGLRRAWGGWRGTADLGRFRALPLRVGGGLLRPCPRGVAAARAAGERSAVLLADAAAAILARLRASELDGLPMARRGVNTAEEVWGLVEPCHLGISHARGSDRVEIGLAVPWDEEHLWGARFRDWRLVEVCESVQAIR